MILEKVCTSTWLCRSPCDGIQVDDVLIHSQLDDSAGSALLLHATPTLPLLLHGNDLIFSTQLANILAAAEKYCTDMPTTQQCMKFESQKFRHKRASWLGPLSLRNPFKTGLLLSPDSPEVQFPGFLIPCAVCTLFLPLCGGQRNYWFLGRFSTPRG